MKRLYPKFLITLFSLSLIAIGFAFAEDPDAFLVEVEPSTFGVSEAVNVTISAVKNWMIVKDYIWDVFVEVSWLIPDEYVVPSDWLYSFLIQDQGIKLFSKWLKIKKSWTYTLKVSDIIDESIFWETTIIVWNWNNGGDLKEVTISSPINWSTENNSSITVMWSSEDLKNSPVEIYLNNIPVSNWYTDAQGNFSIYVEWLQEWPNQIEAKIVDINDVVLWQTDTIIITYESLSDGIFNSIEILPSNDLKQGDEAVFNVYTAEGVTSVELKFSDGKTFPLDRLSPWVFNKDMKIMSKWDIDISVVVAAEGNTKNYSNIAHLSIEENIAVWDVKFHSVWVDGTSVNVSWNPIWDAPKYKIAYGTDRNSLQKTIDVTSTQVLIENLQPDTVYYFQIEPLNEQLHASWEPSDVVEYNPKDVYSSCVVKWIIVASEKIGDKYYLTRGEVENVSKYEIYKSDRENMSDRKKIWEVTDTRFEYQFNKYAEKDTYAYYQVEAICSDWLNITIDEAKKVKVWPFENTILIIIITLFLYSIFRLYRTVE